MVKAGLGCVVFTLATLMALLSQDTVGRDALQLSRFTGAPAAVEYRLFTFCLGFKVHPLAHNCLEFVFGSTASISNRGSRTIATSDKTHSVWSRLNSSQRVDVVLQSAETIYMETSWSLSASVCSTLAYYVRVRDRTTCRDGRPPLVSTVCLVNAAQRVLVRNA